MALLYSDDLHSSHSSRAAHAIAILLLEPSERNMTSNHELLWTKEIWILVCIIVIYRLVQRERKKTSTVKFYAQRVKLAKNWIISADPSKVVVDVVGQTCPSLLTVSPTTVPPAVQSHSSCTVVLP